MLNRRLPVLIAVTAVAGAALVQAQTSAPSYYLPKGYTLTPFLSQKPVRKFKDTTYVLADNVDYMAVLETTKGRIVIDLFEDDTPVTVNNFVFLARNKFYDGIAFHRVLEEFMAQTGDPNTVSGKRETWGTGGPGYSFGDEFRRSLTFQAKGDVAMANSGPATNGSQFFITFTKTDHLNGRHTIFGKVKEGDAVLDKLTRVDPQSADASVKPDKLNRVYIVQKKR